MKIRLSPFVQLYPPFFLLYYMIIFQVCTLRFGYFDVCSLRFGYIQYSGRPFFIFKKICDSTCENDPYRDLDTYSTVVVPFLYLKKYVTVLVKTTLIVLFIKSYVSNFYVGMVLEKNGRPYIAIQNVARLPLQLQHFALV